MEANKEINPNPGVSMLFIGKCYKDTDIACYVDDQVIIHPVLGVSQATKSYPGKIATDICKGQDGDAKGIIKVLTVKGIKDNDSFNAWMNDYLFNRLEFVKRNYKGN